MSHLSGPLALLLAVPPALAAEPLGPTLGPWVALTAGVGLGLPAGLSPGPMTALVITQTLRHGRGEGLKVAVAPLLTDGPLLVLSATVAAALPGGAWLGGLSLLGAIVLLGLAWETWRAPMPEAVPADQAVDPRSLSKAVATNLFNPHPWVFWLTIGGPTVARCDGLGAAAAFAGGFLGCLVAAKVGLAALMGALHGRLPPTAWRITMIVLALGLAAFALWFGADGLHRLRGA